MSIDSRDSNRKAIDSDDPRLTAYALGELEGEARAAFEAHLLMDPAAREEVDALRALAQQLESELAPTERDAQLDVAARDTVLRTAKTASAGSNPWRVVRWASAACVLIGLVALTVLIQPTVRKKSRRMYETAGGRDAPEFAEVGRALPVEDVEEVADVKESTEETWGMEFGVAGGPKPESVKVVSPGARPDGASQPTSVGGVVIPTAGSGGGPQVVHVPDPTELTSYSGRVSPGLRQPDDPAAPAAAPTVGAIGIGGGGGGHGVRVVPMQPGLDPAAAARARRLLDQAAHGKLRRGAPSFGSERYEHPGIDPFHRVTKSQGHTSTFSVDVDTASYANIRRMLRSGRLPPPAAVRVEELINYFDYGYATPETREKVPFRTHVQIATCPWEPKHRIARIAIKGHEVDAEKRPAANLVFLVDVSGSMQGEDKLPLVKAGLERLAESIRDDDRIAIVTYAAEASLRLASTPGSEREAILAGIRALKAGGSTNGAGGIQMAYAEAQKGYRKGGVNRVILCTDGDFNVGISDTNGLVRLISQKAKTGVYLSVLGYGTGNFQDGKMEALSNKGNGNYAYIDSQKESERVLVEEMQGTLVTIAKDVKFQLWFNPKTVAGWRLLGYENRRLAARDFNDDTKDAGDIGAGHEVTALYEIIPTGAGVPGTVDPNPFVTSGVKAAPQDDAPKPQANALFIWRLRWKAPEGTASQLVERNVFDKGLSFEQSDRDLQWATAVGAFGMLLRRSPHRGQATWDLVSELAAPAKGEDPSGRRAEFIDLVKRAQGLMGGR